MELRELEELEHGGAPDVLGRISEDSAQGRSDARPNYMISTAMWSEIGADQVKAIRMVPLELARAIKNIHTHHTGYHILLWTT